MFVREKIFAWIPVKVGTRTGSRWAWLEPVMRERAETDRGSTSWRYYA